jgi:hypothetical protein
MVGGLGAAASAGGVRQRTRSRSRIHLLHNSITATEHSHRGSRVHLSTHRGRTSRLARSKTMRIAIIAAFAAMVGIGMANAATQHAPVQQDSPFDWANG